MIFEPVFQKKILALIISFIMEYSGVPAEPEVQELSVNDLNVSTISVSWVYLCSLLLAGARHSSSGSSNMIVEAILLVLIRTSEVIVILFTETLVDLAVSLADLVGKICHARHNAESYNTLNDFL